MPPAGFEPAISAGERPKTHALDRARLEPSPKNNSDVHPKAAWVSHRMGLDDLEKINISYSTHRDSNPGSSSP